MKVLIHFAKMMFTLGLLFIVIGLALTREDDILSFTNQYILHRDLDVAILDPNEYYREDIFAFVKNTDDFSPKNKQDILNIYYTIINSGKEEFTFYCPKEYIDCREEIERLANNRDLLSDINNFVHPFNSFSHIETEYDSLGRVTVFISRTYRKDEIKKINQKVEELYPHLVKEEKNVVENLQSIHDYIITHAKYDSNRSDFQDTTYRSDTAYGPLFEGYAICGGYTDLMQLFLEKMKLENYRISSNRHVWNAVKINNSWYHIDLTWDDPVASDGKDYLEHKYFIITTKKLLEQEKTQHDFNPEIYQELKEA